MRRMLLAILALAGGMLVNAGIELLSASGAKAALEPPRRESKAPAAPTAPAGPSLADLAAGRLEVVDLAWPINPRSAFWPGENYRPFELHTIATLEKDGVLSKAFSMPEHLGTHLDAPNHFERNQPALDQIPAGQFFAPGVLIDVSAKAALDADYRVTADDLREFEDAHGPIPSGAVVLAYTGWSKFWDTPARYQNQDVMGRLHFPGFSAEAAQWLVDKRQARGLGLDTLSVDYGLSRDFSVHHVLGKAGRYGLENLANLDKLPPRDFYLFVAPIKIETGSGGPARVFALWPKGGAAE